MNPTRRSLGDGAHHGLLLTDAIGTSKRLKRLVLLVGESQRHSHTKRYQIDTSVRTAVGPDRDGLGYFLPEEVIR